MRTIVALVFASVCIAQQTEFEVASVKPNTSGRPGSDFNRMPGGGLNAINVTLREMITFAWNIRDHQLIGAAGWMDSDRYDVFAKPTQNDNPSGAARSFEADFDPIRVKMRSLLIDRFKLAAHIETREMPVYALTVGKGGSHLTPSKSDGLTLNNRKGLVICKKCSMKAFANGSLSWRMGRPVIDKTDLPGEYDFEIKFTDDSAAPNAESAGPDFLTAMRETLGLVLQSQKAPRDGETPCVRVGWRLAVCAGWKARPRGYPGQDWLPHNAASRNLGSCRPSAGVPARLPVRRQDCLPHKHGLQMFEQREEGSRV